MANLPSILPIPLITLFGMITNIINVIVLNKIKTKNNLFKYMLVMSGSDLLYQFLAMFCFIEFCTDCSLNKSYLTQLFIISIDDYLTSCLAFFRILLEISISIERYLVVLNKKCFIKFSFNSVIVISMSISLLYYLPVIFVKEITQLKELNETENSFNGEYSLQKNNFGSTIFGKLIPIILTSIRLFSGTFLLIGINLFIMRECNKRFANPYIVSALKGI